MTHRDERRLEDILRAIDSILKYRPGDREEFEEDEPLQSHVKLKLQIIGEAASNLDSDIKETAPDVPWREMVGMRNILVHEYEHVDHDILWDVVVSELPELRMRIDQLRRRLQGDRPEGPRRR